MAKLTAKGRKQIKPSNFAIPSEKKYPVDTKARARNALARVSQHGTASEKAMVRKKVYKKYPSLDPKKK